MQDPLAKRKRCEEECHKDTTQPKDKSGTEKQRLVVTSPASKKFPASVIQSRHGESGDAAAMQREGTAMQRDGTDALGSAIAAPQTDASQGKEVGQKEEKRKYRYVCPFCESAVPTSVRTGNVDHRHACGHQFRVREGRVATKAFVYICPFCSGKVGSSVKTGRINHGTVCGNQFYVQEGAVRAATRHHPHKCPSCHTTVWSSRVVGQIRVAHAMPSGKPCAKKSWQVQGHK